MTKTDILADILAGILALIALIMVAIGAVTEWHGAGYNALFMLATTAIAFISAALSLASLITHWNN